jgi:hypothetical protein
VRLKAKHACALLRSSTYDKLVSSVAGEDHQSAHKQAPARQAQHPVLLVVSYRPHGELPRNAPRARAAATLLGLLYVDLRTLRSRRAQARRTRRAPAEVAAGRGSHRAAGRRRTVLAARRTGPVAGRIVPAAPRTGPVTANEPTAQSGSRCRTWGGAELSGAAVLAVRQHVPVEDRSSPASQSVNIADRVPSTLTSPTHLLGRVAASVLLRRALLVVRVGGHGLRSDRVDEAKKRRCAASPPPNLARAG